VITPVLVLVNIFIGMEVALILVLLL